MSSGNSGAVPKAARKALESAMSRSHLDNAMQESSEFSLRASPSVDLYLATAKQEKKGVVQRPGMSSLNPAPKTVAGGGESAGGDGRRENGDNGENGGTTAACQIFQVLTSTKMTMS